MVSSYRDDNRAPSGAPVRPQKNFYNNIYLQPIGTDCPDGGGGAGPAEAGEAEEQAETHEEFRSRVRPGPSEPSPLDRDQHECTGHSVFRDWCGACVEGRGRALPHTRHDHQHDVTPVISWDYGFLGSKTHGGDEDVAADRSGQSPVLCGRDRSSQSCFWYVVPFKGTDYPTIHHLVNKITTDLRSLGYNRVCFRSDGERPIKSVLNLVSSA